MTDWTRLSALDRKRAMEAHVRHYFDCCNRADRQGLIDCFTPDAVHYFPAGLPGVPWRGAETIAEKWVWCVQELGSSWAIERMITDIDRNELVIEWTHWKSKQGKALRGDEWYLFDLKAGRISEIRAYYAAPADQSVTINEIVDYDYAGMKYSMSPPVPRD